MIFFVSVFTPCEVQLWAEAANKRHMAPQSLKKKNSLKAETVLTLQEKHFST